MNTLEEASVKLHIDYGYEKEPHLFLEPLEDEEAGNLLVGVNNHCFLKLSEDQARELLAFIEVCHLPTRHQYNIIVDGDGFLSLWRNGADLRIVISTLGSQNAVVLWGKGLDLFKSSLRTLYPTEPTPPCSGAMGKECDKPATRVTQYGSKCEECFAKTVTYIISDKRRTDEEIEQGISASQGGDGPEEEPVFKFPVVSLQLTDGRRILLSTSPVAGTSHDYSIQLLPGARVSQVSSETLNLIFNYRDEQDIPPGGDKLRLLQDVRKILPSIFEAADDAVIAKAGGNKFVCQAERNSLSDVETFLNELLVKAFEDCEKESKE